LLHRIAQTIERYRMFELGQKVGVAVSGGADSVCLLHALVELAPRWGLQLSVLHLDHQLRGAESREDAAFVRDLAGSLGLPFMMREADVAAASRVPKPDNLEQAARRARLAFFRDVVAAGAVARVAVGHTRSDQAETVLFRFLRGSGTAGLSSIRPVTDEGIVRPLIEIDRGEVTQFLRERGIRWREDSSNADPAFARNRIRHELLPQLAREWNPAIGQVLAHTADWALAEEAYWKTEMDRLAAGHFTASRGAILMRADALTALPLAAARRLVRRAFELVKGGLLGIDFRHVSEVLELAAGHTGTGRVQVPELDIRRSFEWLRVARQNQTPKTIAGYRWAATVPGTLRVPGADFAICLELIEKAETFEVPESVYNSEMGCLDWRRLSSSLELRNWKAGDQYQPLGSTGEAKIKTLFQQARIPVWERADWPVLTDGESIIWTRHFGPAAQFVAGPGSGPVLQIREVAVRSDGTVTNSESGSGGMASIALRGLEVS
jgi:tRNA(Ile)-lysidine synthase